MVESLPSARGSSTKPRLKHLGTLLLVVGLLSVVLLVGAAAYVTTRLAAPLVTPWLGSVPQISGTVVDAVTGQPLPGMDVCLIAMSKGIGGTSFDRKDVTQTDAAGKFSFAPSAQKGLGFEGYEMEIADPASQISDYCGRFRDVLENPNLLSRWPLPSGDYSKRFYFPVAIVERAADVANDPTQYGPMLQKFTDPGKIRIALIPLFQDESECAAIKDQTNAAYCRRLNSFGEATLLRKQSQPSPKNR